MKKKLEAELISIAHRILKLKNKSELVQLHQEAQKLYEKLSVLLFVEQNFAEVQPTIGRAEIVEKLEVIFDKEDEVAVVNIQEAIVENKVEEEAKKEELVPVAAEVIPEIEEEVEEAIAESKPEPISAETEQAVEEEEEPVEKYTKAADEKALDAIADEDTFKPSFELSFEAKEEEAKPSKAQISFEDLLGSSYVEPVFVKPEEAATEKKQSSGPTGDSAFVSASELISNYKAQSETKSSTLNDRLSKGITIGLNDRMAFIKQLFGGSDEDYNRVLSQLITFDTFDEAQSFIDDMVKPDYNDWDGKEEYSKRFMEIIERKFS